MSAPSLTLLKLTRPSENVWQLSFNAPPDNRLTDDMLKQFKLALDHVEKEWRDECGWRNAKPMQPPKGAKGGALIVTSEIQKFFSNGLDYQNSIKNPDFHPDVFNPVITRLLTFPLVTIAAINGHAFAGGMMFAMACDFRLMTSGKAWMCMNELEFGAPFPPLFGALLSYRAKHANPTLASGGDGKPSKPHPFLIRSIAMAHRFTPSDALANGLVDELVESSQLRQRAIELGEKEGAKVKFGVWGSMKAEIYREVIEAGSRGKVHMPWEASAKFYESIDSAQKRPSKL